MSRWLTLVLCLGLGAACGEPDSTLVFVTVSARSTVLDATELQVTVHNQDASASDSFDLGGRDFPVTFTVTPRNRTGDILVEVTARNEHGLVRGSGSGSGSLIADQQVDVDIRLDPADFVVNSSIAGTQKLTFVSEATGRQLAVAGDDSFLITFVNDCALLSRCDIFGRRFDVDTSPAANDITQDSNEFIANLSDDLASVPAIAIGSTGALATWYVTNDSVRAVALTHQAGHASATETTISTTDLWVEDPAVAALDSGDFVVVWAETNSEYDDVIRGRLIRPDGTPRSNPITSDTLDFPVSTLSGHQFALPSVTSIGDGHGFVVVWRNSNNIFARYFDRTAAPTGAEVQLTTYDPSAFVYGPHVAWIDDSIAVVWGVTDWDSTLFGEGAFLLRRFETPSLQPLTSTRMLTTSTPDSFSAPALAVRDHMMAAVWHNCGNDGDAAGCGVLLQMVRPSGLTLGDPVVVNTTRFEDQTGPSIAARSDSFIVTWSDTSQQPPDTVDGAVRARVLYPDSDANDGRRGARCGQPGDATCGDNLVCMPGTDGGPFCHEACDRAGPEPQCPTGGLCTTLGASSGCLF